MVDEATGDWRFLIKYDPGSLTVDDIARVYRYSLQPHPGPLCPAPHEVVMVLAGE